MKILLVCSGGMSTSILITALEKEASKNNVSDFSALAVGTGEFDAALNNAVYDLVLVAPQVRYRFSEFNQKVTSKGIKIYQIQPTEYTSLGAPNLMQSILKVMG